jgi:hypothetical protein
VYVSLLSRLAGRFYAQQANVEDCGDLLIRASLASHCLRNRERVARIDALTSADAINPWKSRNHGDQ